MEIDTSLSIGRATSSSFVSWQDSSTTEHPLARNIQAFGAKMDIKGFGIIQPQCPSNIAEIILTEIDQINIDNNNLEEITLSSTLNSNLIYNHHWRPSEKSMFHHIIEKESRNISLINQGIVKLIKIIN